jgi:hypothetical protein
LSVCGGLPHFWFGAYEPQHNAHILSGEIYTYFLNVNENLRFSNIDTQYTGSKQSNLYWADGANGSIYAQGKDTVHWGIVNDTSYVEVRDKCLWLFNEYVTFNDTVEVESWIILDSVTTGLFKMPKAATDTNTCLFMGALAMSNWNWWIWTRCDDYTDTIFTIKSNSSGVTNCSTDIFTAPQFRSRSTVELDDLDSNGTSAKIWFKSKGAFRANENASWIGNMDVSSKPCIYFKVYEDYTVGFDSSNPLILRYKEAEIRDNLIVVEGAETTYVDGDSINTEKVVCDFIDADSSNLYVPRTMIWYVDGDVSTGTQTGPTIIPENDITLIDIKLHVETAPTGQALIVDINDDGVSVFSTNPEIDAAGTREDDNHAFGSTSIVAGSEVTFDVDQVGSGTAGADLTVMLECKELIIHQ